MGMPIPDLSSLPGNSRPGRPGGGGGGPTVQQVTNKYSFAFDNTSATYMRLSNFTSDLVSEANTNNGFTVSLWYKTSSVGVNYYLLGSGGNQQGPFTIQGSGTNPRFTIRDGSNQVTNLTTSNAPVTTNTWYHFVCVWDGTASPLERMKIYVDGVLNESSSVQGPTSMQQSGTYFNEDTLINAYRDSPLSVSSSDTRIDEIGIFTRSLNNDEVLAIYNATSSGMTANLSTLSTGAPYAWYRMGD